MQIDEIISTDETNSYVVVDYWIPIAGYEARRISRVDSKTEETTKRITQMRKNGDEKWFNV